jgi:hypothetical protein
MLGLFRRTHNKGGVGSVGRSVLGLERLELRDQPSAAPVIVNFSDYEIGNGLVLLKGQVVDQNPGGLVVTFGGIASANGLTVVTNADGTFSDTVQLLLDGTDVGFLTATTVDSQSLVSMPVAVFVNPIAHAGPVIIDFEAEQIGNGLFLISGQVVDQNPGGLVVTFGGDTTANGMTVTTTPDGTFSCTIRLPVDGTGAGTLTATTVDGQGLVSASVQVFLDPTPP